jgi:7,8-dihydropterin-6-yl-methyl-4-(beta-D-ribofuranosyl)aminobenzene 5'-phosphate synthase
MKLTVLSDAKAMTGFQPEHGLSFLIESGQMKLLFDTGASKAFMMNAIQLGLDPDGVDMVVLSHGHFDHGDGLPYLKHNTLLCHPGCFVRRYRRRGNGNIGISLNEEEIRQRFDLKTSREPLQISENLFFLGEVPRINDFESGETPYILDGGEPDFIRDDSALACVAGEELVVVSGCAHSGICNTIAHARKVTGKDKVEAVIGGFHLRNADSRTRKTIACIREMDVRQVYPSHCTAEPALGMFHEAFGHNEVLVGQEFFF